MPSMSWAPKKRLAAPRAPTEFDKRLGERMRVVRREKEASIEYVSRKIGISWQMYQKYEFGQCRVTVGRLIDICRELGVTVSYVLNPLL